MVIMLFSDCYCVCFLIYVA